MQPLLGFGTHARCSAQIAPASELRSQVVESPPSIVGMDGVTVPVRVAAVEMETVASEKPVMEIPDKPEQPPLMFRESESALHVESLPTASVTCAFKQLGSPAATQSHAHEAAPPSVISTTLDPPASPP